MPLGDSNGQIEHKDMWNSVRNSRRKGLLLSVADTGNGTESSLVASKAANVSSRISTTASDSTELYIESDGVFETKALVSELCQQFYGLGWVSGTGGSVTIKVLDDKISKSEQLVVMSPSGVQKERMKPEDMYVLSSNGFVLSTPPPKPYPHGPSKCSECTPLFLKVYEMCNAGAVIHSHGIEACLVTMIRPFMKEFRITHMEMIKGIKGHGYHDELVVPIIENTAKEGELIETLTEAIKSYPKSTAVLVRNHGVYIWGETWITAKTQAECYHYLFDAAVKLYQLGYDWSTPDHGPIYNTNRVYGFSGNSLRGYENGSLGSDNMTDLRQRYILLDIEETTTPVSFVNHVLATCANDKLVKQLSYDNNVLQSNEHILRIESQSNDIAGNIFGDVPKALKRWHASGNKVYVFSIFGRLIQQHLFRNSNHGDLRKYLSGYFDTTLGSKKEKQTFMEILLTVGVDRPADMLYVTSNLLVAFAAKASGLEVTLVNRPGNEPLTQNHGFTIVESLLEL